jgi:hypothetical protein
VCVCVCVCVRVWGAGGVRVFGRREGGGGERGGVGYMWLYCLTSVGAGDEGAGDTSEPTPNSPYQRSIKVNSPYQRSIKVNFVAAE